MKIVFFVLILSFLLGCASGSGYTTKGASKKPFHQKFGTVKSKQIDHQKGNSLYMVTSYYGKKFHGKPTSNGETFDMKGLTAAHKTLPFGTVLKVTNEDNGKSVTVRINDRGPFVAGRDLDLSFGAAKKIEMITAGVKTLKVEILE